MHKELFDLIFHFGYPWIMHAMNHQPLNVYLGKSKIHELPRE